MCFWGRSSDTLGMPQDLRAPSGAASSEATGKIDLGFVIL